MLCLGATLSAQFEKCPVASEARPKVMLEGDAVGEFEKGKVYIIALWASWPGNQEMVRTDQYRENISVIPWMAELQKTLGAKGLVVLTVAFGEKDPAKAAELIQKFKAEGVIVRTGFDADRAMANAWLDGDVNHRTPRAFAIAQGRVIWEGHPVHLTPALVTTFIDGTYSPEKAAQAKAKVESLQGSLLEALQRGRLQQAETLLGEVLPLMPEADREPYAEMVQAGIAMRKGDASLALKQLRARAEATKDDASEQNDMANDVMVLFERGGHRSFLEVASSCAERAVKLATEKNPDGTATACCLDTLARVRFMQGKQAEAIQLQEQALAKMENADAKKALRETLESYKRGVLPPMIMDPSQLGR